MLKNDVKIDTNHESMSRYYIFGGLLLDPTEWYFACDKYYNKNIWVGQIEKEVSESHKYIDWRKQLHSVF